MTTTSMPPGRVTCRRRWAPRLVAVAVAFALSVALAPDSSAWPTLRRSPLETTPERSGVATTLRRSAATAQHAEPGRLARAFAWAKRRWRRLRANRAFVLPLAPGRFVHLSDGTRLHYQTWGAADRPTVLLLHGLGCSTETWARLARRLGRDHHVVAVDLPGHGYSAGGDGHSMKLQDQARVVERFMDAVGIKRAAVVGHSMGGGIGALLAAHAPSRVSKLALLDSVGFPYKLKLSNRLLLTRWLGKLLMTRLTGRAAHAFAVRHDAFADRSRYTDHDANVRYAHFNTPERRRAVFRAARASVDVAAVQSSAGNIAAPTLVLWGEKDHVIPLDVGRRLQSAIPHAELDVLRGVGHETINEAPGKVAARLRSFLAAE